MKLPALLCPIAVVLLLPAVAAAEPSSADRATARELGKDGEAALKRKDFTTAADRFARAEALFHAPTLVLGLARAQVGLGKLVDAEESYRKIINEPLPANPPPAFVHAQTAAKAELAAVQPRLAWITITVSGVDGATVKIDGQPLASAAFGVKRAVDPGAHEIVAEVSGTVVDRTPVTLGEGQEQSIPLALTAPAGLPAGPAAPSSGQPPATAPGGTPASGGSMRKTLGFVGIGVGGAALLMGVGTGAGVLAMHGSLKTDCTGGKCPQQDVSKLGTYDALGAASTAGFIAGGVLAAAGVVLVVTAPKAAPAGATVGWSLSPIAGGAVLGAEGSFQ